MCCVRDHALLVLTIRSKFKIEVVQEQRIIYGCSKQHCLDSSEKEHQIQVADVLG